MIRLADASTLPYRYSFWVHFDCYMSSFAGKEELSLNIHRLLAEGGLQVTAEMRDIRLPGTSVSPLEAPKR